MPHQAWECSLTERARLHWPADRPPKCFTPQAWREWLLTREGAHAPCTDCTPCHRRQMLQAGRCERPEVVFVIGRQTREVEGIVADDPRYARLLMGLALTNADVIGRQIERTEEWERLLRIIRERAHARTKKAIDIWLRRKA